MFPNAVTETIDEITGVVVRAIDKDVMNATINRRILDWSKK